MPTAPNWLTRIVDLAGRLHVADEALQLEKDTRRQRATEFAISQAYKAAGLKDPHPLEDKDLGVQVGDQQTTIYKGSNLPSMLLAALTGGAVAAGAAWWLNQPSDETPPTPAPANAPAWSQQDYTIKPGTPTDWQPE